MAPTSPSGPEEEVPEVGAYTPALREQAALIPDGAREPPDDGGEEHFLRVQTWRFWAIIPALMVATLLNAIEVTIMSTALPTIVQEIGMGREYLWVVNAFLLTATAFIPIIGQLADIWGRRWPMLICVAIFTAGAALSGGATSAAVLIVGRAIQGSGSGGLTMLIELIVCDLVPLRERGRLMSMVNGVFAIGLFAGPFLGGTIVEHASWRWAFWISLPVGAVAFVLLFFFLHVGREHEPFCARMARLDYAGNLLVVGSCTAVLYALTYGGTAYAWSSARVAAPLALGLAGIALFHWYQVSRFCANPTMPPRLFRNRTSCIAFMLTFVHALLTLWELYFLPVYFQAVQLASPSASGVHILPTVLGMAPAAVATGLYMTLTGRYKLPHLVGVVLFAAGLGSLAALDARSPLALWVCLQAVPALGCGLLSAALLPAAQAGLADADNAASVATFSYIRGYGAVWGVAIPAAVFANVFEAGLWRVTDPRVRAQLAARPGGYSFASSEFIAAFPQPTRDEIVDTYTHALRVSWAVAAAIMAVAGVFAPFMRDLPLRQSLQTRFGFLGLEKNVARRRQDVAAVRADASV